MFARERPTLTLDVRLLEYFHCRSARGPREALRCVLPSTLLLPRSPRSRRQGRDSTTSSTAGLKERNRARCRQQQHPRRAGDVCWEASPPDSEVATCQKGGSSSRPLAREGHSIRRGVCARPASLARGAHLTATRLYVCRSRTTYDTCTAFGRPRLRGTHTHTHV